jgi:hypothetical protein
MTRETDGGIQILGRTVWLKDFDAASSAWFERLWVFPEYRRFFPNAHPFTLHLTAVNASVPEVSSVKKPSVELLVLGEHCPVVTESENSFRFGDESAGCVLELEDQSAVIRIWGLDFTHSARARAALFATMIEALTASGLVCIHAAIASRKARAWAMLGPSGRGKSTTLLRAIQSGWRALAEDMSWFDPDSGLLYGWDRGLRLLPDSTEHLRAWKPELEGDVQLDDKRFVPFDALGGTDRPSSLERLVLLERDDREHSVWERIDRTTLAVALWDAIGLPFSPRSQRTVSAAMTRLASSIEGWRLILGRDLPDFGTPQTG